MKRQLDRLKGKRLVTGDPNLMTKDEICINATPNGVEVKEIGTDGKIKDLAGSKGGGSNTEEEHWIGLQVGIEDMGVYPFPMAVFNFSELGKRLGNIYINKGIGAITEQASYGYGSIAHGGLLTYGDMMIPFKSASGVTYYQLFCVNIKKGERLIYTNKDGVMQYDVPVAPNYNFGDELFTLEEIENKILESKLFTNHPRNERIVAILSVIGLLVAFSGNYDEWYGNNPIDEYLTNAGVDMFTTLEIVYPNKDEMLELVKQTIINYKG